MRVKKRNFIIVGETLGPDIVLNGDFLNWSGPNDLDDWSEVQPANSEITQVDSGALHGGASGTGGSVNFWNNNAAAERPVLQQSILTVGITYYVVVTVSAYASGTFELLLGALNPVISETSTGVFQVTAQCLNSGLLDVRNTNFTTGDFTLDRITIQEVL